MLHAACDLYTYHSTFPGFVGWFFWKLRFFHFAGWNSMLGKVYIPKFFWWLIYIHLYLYRYMLSESVSPKFKKIFWNDSYLFTVLGSGVPPCLNPQHQAMPKTSNSLPNKITRSFWLPHLAAILAFTAETWLSLSASMWKSSSKRRKIVRSRSQTHMPVGYQDYASGWNGWALQGLNSTSKEN